MNRRKLQVSDFKSVLTITYKKNEVIIEDLYKHKIVISYPDPLEENLENMVLKEIESGINTYKISLPVSFKKGTIK